MKSTVIRSVLLALVVGAAITTACNEQHEAHYPTVAAAAEAGEFKRGWLPAELKPDVTDIQEWHDVDTNEVRGKFALNDSFLHRLQSNCKQSADVPRHIRSAPSWWRDHVTHDEAASSIGEFRCGNFFIVAVTRNRAGYFWANSR